MLSSVAGLHGFKCCIEHCGMTAVIDGNLSALAVSGLGMADRQFHIALV